MDSVPFSLLRVLTCHLAAVPVARRFSEAVRRRYSKVATPRLVANFDGDLKVLCYPNSHISSAILWFGAYSREQIPFLRRYFEEDFVFVDVGSNEGEQTLLAAKRTPRGRVLAFEPQSLVRERLQKNIALNNFAQVKVFSQGLGEKKGQLKLFGSDGPGSDGSMNLGQSSLHPRAGISVEIESIEIVPLDEVLAEERLARLDLLKIDVEGAELQVLRGAEATLKKFSPDLILEVAEATLSAAHTSAKEIQEFLSRMGYRYYQFCPDGRLAAIDDLAKEASRDIFATQKAASALQKYL